MDREIRKLMIIVLVLVMALPTFSFAIDGQAAMQDDKANVTTEEGELCDCEGDDIVDDECLDNKKDDVEEDCLKNGKKIKKKKNINKGNIFLTITERGANDADKLNSRACVLNQKINGLTTVAKFSHNAKYSLAFYDFDTNTLYHTSRVYKYKEIGDQLFSLKANYRGRRPAVDNPRMGKKSKQLTNNLLAISYIVKIDKENLLLVAASKKSTVFKPMIYNTVDGSLKDMNWEKDLNLWYVTRDTGTGKVYVTGRSGGKNEGDKKTGNKDQTVETLSSKVFFINKDLKLEEVYSAKDQTFDEILVNGNDMLVRGTEGKKEFVNMVDMKTGKGENVNSIDSESIKGMFHFNKKENLLYVNTGEEIKTVNYVTGTEKNLIEMDKNKAYINNATMVE